MKITLILSLVSCPMDIPDHGTYKFVTRQPLNKCAAGAKQEPAKLYDELVRAKCVPCRGGEPTLTDQEIAELRPKVARWSLVERDGIKRLERVFRFEDFANAMAFTEKVAGIAESEGHHPALLTEWGRVTVTWWTHKIRGLHKNDFIMAAKTEML